MNRLYGFRGGIRRAALVLAAAGTLSACADAGAPLGPESLAVTATSQDALLSGIYVSRQPVDLSDGARIYLVEVHFGAQPVEPVYLAQVGVGAGSSARLELEQRSYRHAAGSIEFATLLERGTLRDGGRWLDVDVTIDGERVRVALARQ